MNSPVLLDGETIPLVGAAARARVRYTRMLNYVLTGAVRGRQRDGRWVVEVADLERFLRERDQAQPTAA